MFFPPPVLIQCACVCLCFRLTAPVLGNFTEEEVNGSTLPQDTLEYPLQRDEVQNHHTKGERNHQIPQSKCIREQTIRDYSSDEMKIAVERQ